MHLQSVVACMPFFPTDDHPQENSNQVNAYKRKNHEYQPPAAFRTRGSAFRLALDDL